MESRFGTIKTELEVTGYSNRQTAVREITEYTHDYNNERRHSALDYLTPAQFVQLSCRQKQDNDLSGISCTTSPHSVSCGAEAPLPARIRVSLPSRFHIGGQMFLLYLLSAVRVVQDFSPPRCIRWRKRIAGKHLMLFSPQTTLFVLACSTGRRKSRSPPFLLFLAHRLFNQWSGFRRIAGRLLLRFLWSRAGC